MAHFAPAAPLLLARPGLPGGSGGLNDTPLGDRRPSLPDHETVLLDGGDDAVVTNPHQSPLRSPVSAWPKRRGVLAASDPFAQVAQYPLLRACAELVQVADSGPMKFDPPDWRGHQRFTAFVTCRSSFRQARKPRRAQSFTAPFRGLIQSFRFVGSQPIRWRNALAYCTLYARHAALRLARNSPMRPSALRMFSVELA
jgi:hypothetical protein